MINIENPTNSRVLGNVIEFVIADKQFIFWKIVKSSNSLQDFFNNPQFEFIIKDICELRGISINEFMKHINQIIVLNDNQEKTHKSKFKHLRGQHDQRDHAWNRGMGGGGSAGGELGPNQMGPLPTMQWYQQRRAEFSAMVRNGEMTRTDMRNQLRELRGMIPTPSRRDSTNIILASRRANAGSPQSNNPTPSGGVNPSSTQQTMTTKQILQEVKQIRQDVHDAQIDAVGKMQNVINQVLSTKTYNQMAGIKPSIIIQTILNNYANAIALGQYIHQMRKNNQIQIPSTVTENMLGANNPYDIDIATVKSIALMHGNVLSSALSQDKSNFAYSANSALLDMINPTNATSPTYAADLQMAYAALEPFFEFVKTAQNATEKINNHLMVVSERFDSKFPERNELTAKKTEKEQEKDAVDKIIYQTYRRDQVVVDLENQYKVEKVNNEKLSIIADNAAKQALSDFEKITEYENARGEKVRQKLISQGVLTDAESAYDVNDPFSKIHPLVQQELSKQIGHMILTRAYNSSHDKEKKAVNKLNESTNYLNEIAVDRDNRINVLAQNHPMYAKQQQLKQELQEISRKMAIAPNKDQYMQNSYIFHNAIFDALQHATPYQNTQISPPSDAFYNPANGKYAYRYSGNTEQLIVNTIRGTMSMFPNTSFWNSNLAFLDFANAYRDKRNPNRETMDTDKGTMTILPSTSLSTYTHETMHFMQALFHENLFYTHKFWIENRIKNEQLQPLQLLEPRGTYSPDEFAYKDSVDDAYTLKYYDATSNNIPTTADIIKNGNITQFAEIHSMAFTDLHKLYERTDHELFMQTLFSIFMLSNDDEVVKSFRSFWDTVMKLHK